MLTKANDARPRKRTGRGQGTTTVAAVLLPAERPAVEAISRGYFDILHRDSIPDAVQAVRERPVDAVLLSVQRVASEQVGQLHRLAQCFPGVPAVAVMTRTDAVSPTALLRLGATGVREVVDLTTPSGWTRLRTAVTQPTGRAAARILARVTEALPDLTPDGRYFLETLVRSGSHLPVVRKLAAEIGVRPSTIVSRFARAGLPSPKSYLAGVRLVHAAHLFDSEGMAIADVAYRLEYSSPQSFGRHLRTMLGITCGEFRRRFPFAVAADRFVRLLIAPYAEAWSRFHPLERVPEGRVLPDDPAALDEGRL